MESFPKKERDPNKKRGEEDERRFQKDGERPIEDIGKRKERMMGLCPEVGIDQRKEKEIQIKEKESQIKEKEDLIKAIEGQILERIIIIN